MAGRASHLLENGDPDSMAGLMKSLTRGLVDDEAVDEVIARHMLTPSPKSPYSNGAEGNSTHESLWWKKKLTSWEGRAATADRHGADSPCSATAQPNAIPEKGDNSNGNHLDLQASPDRWAQQLQSLRSAATATITTLEKRLLQTEERLREEQAARSQWKDVATQLRTKLDTERQQAATAMNELRLALSAVTEDRDRLRTLCEDVGSLHSENKKLKRRLQEAKTVVDEPAAREFVGDGERAGATPERSAARIRRLELEREGLMSRVLLLEGKLQEESEGGKGRGRRQSAERVVTVGGAEYREAMRGLQALEGGEGERERSAEGGKREADSAHRRRSRETTDHRVDATPPHAFSRHAPSPPAAHRSPRPQDLLTPAKATPNLPHRPGDDRGGRDASSRSKEHNGLFAEGNGRAAARLEQEIRRARGWEEGGGKGKGWMGSPDQCRLGDSASLSPPVRPHTKLGQFGLMLTDAFVHYQNWEN